MPLGGGWRLVCFMAERPATLPMSGQAVGGPNKRMRLAAKSISRRKFLGGGCRFEGGAFD